MGQILVRNIDDRIIDGLRARARSQGQSLEQTAREALARAAVPTRDELLAFAAEMRARTAERTPTLDMVESIRRDRDGDHGHEWL